MVGGEIKVLMTLDNGQFTIQTAKAGQVIQDLKRSIDQSANSTKRLEKHFTGIGQKFQDVIRTASLLRYALHDVHDIFMALPGAVLKSSGEFERMTKLMQGMSKASTDAARAAEAMSDMRYVFDLAQTSPFKVQALADAFVKLKSGGIDQTRMSLEALTDSVAKFGGGSEQLHRASIAIQQMGGKGVISMEELRQQLGEAVPNAINMMAQGAGKSMQEFTKMVSTGTVASTKALQNMFTVMAFENEGAAASMMETWNGTLSLLATKWELFKVETGDSDFFKEAKEQIEDLVDAFGSQDAKNLAGDLGAAMASVVKAVRAVIDTMREYWGTIKLVGNALLLVFATAKVMQFGRAVTEAFKNYRALLGEKVAQRGNPLQDRLNDINKEIAAEQSAFSKKNDMERQQTSATISERVKRQSELLRLQQQFLAQQMAAEMAADAELRRKKAGSAAAARAQMAEANRFGNNARVLGPDLAALDAEIRALKAKEAALLATTAATRGQTTASIQHAGVAAQVAQHSSRMTELLNRQAVATKAADFATSMLGRTMTGLKLVFNAFGGWVGIAIGALIYLGQKLYEFVNRWDKADEIVRRTRRGEVSEDFKKTAQKRAAEAKKEVDRLNAEMAKLDAASPAGQRGLAKKEGQIKIENGELVGDPAKYRALLKQKLDEQLRVYNEQNETYQKQIKGLDEEQVDEHLSDYRREFDRERKGKTDIFRDNARKLEEAEKNELKNVKQVNGKNDAAKTKEIQERYARLKNNEIKASLDASLSFAAARQDQLKKEIVAIKNNPLEKQKKEAQLQFIEEQVEEIKQRAKNGLDLGKIDVFSDPNKGKGTTSIRENPLVRRAEDAKAAVAAARVKFEEAISGVKDISKLRQQLAIELLGDAAEGKFDDSVPGADGKGKVAKRFGQNKDNKKTILNDRKAWVERFMAEVVSGQKTIEQFIAGLNLAEADADRLLGVIGNMTNAESLEDGARLVERANTIAANSAGELQAALEELASFGIAKEDRALNSLRRQLDELSKDLRLTGADLERFEALRKKALEDGTDARNARSLLEMREQNKKFVQDTMKSTEQVRIARERSTMNYLEVAQNVYDEDVRVFRIAENEKIRDTETRIRTGTVTEKEGQDELMKIYAAGAAYRNELFLRGVEQSKSALDKLADSWRNTVDAMNTMTASWADQFMDALVEMTSGGKVKWREMITSWVKDLAKVQMKKNFGDLVTTAFGKLRGVLGQAFGIKTSDSAATPESRGTTANPMITRDADKVANLADSVQPKSIVETAMKTASERLSDVWTQLKNGVSTIWTSLDGMLGGLMTKLGGFLTTVWDAIMSFFKSDPAGSVSIFPMQQDGNASGVDPNQAPVMSETSSVAKNPVEEMVKAIIGKLSGVWDWLKNGLSTFMGDMSGTLGGVFDMLKGGLSGIWDSLSGMLSNLLGGLGGSAGGGNEMMTDLIGMGMSFFGFAKGGVMSGAGPMSLTKYAKGGVMSGMGPMSLTKYAKGGVANSPQLAMFGEGSTPEAYVPLPDGRTIPVTLSGGNFSSNSSAGGVQINIVINKDGGEKQDASGDQVQEWQRVAQRVRSVVMEELVNQQRPGGVLYK